MVKMEFEKKYGLKAELRYWLWFKWKNLFWIVGYMVVASLKGRLEAEFRANEMDVWNYLGLADAMADAQAGRMYSVEWKD